MNIFEIWPYVAVIPFLSSIVFFFLAKEKDLVQRSCASIHGWEALLILPSSVYVASQYPNLRVSIGVPIILFLGAVSAVSVFYSFAILRGRWVYSLLHVPTVFIIYLSFVFSLFVLSDHH